MSSANLNDTMRRAFEAMQAGRAAEAETLCESVLKQQPRHPGALHMLGLIASGRRDFPKAIEPLRQSIELAPSISEFHNNLGETLLSAGRTDEAIAAYRKAIALKPGDAQPHNNLANALRQLGKADEAMDLYRKAIQLNPRLHQAHFNLGDALKERGELDAAEASFRKALEIKPDYVAPLQHLGLVMLERGKLEESLAHYDRALAIDPNAAQVHFNKSIVLMLQGKLREGLAEYEWRLKCSAFGLRTFAQPRWTGEPLDGRTILVYAEQGMGDAIQLARYIPLIADRGGRVVLECQPPLAPLLRDIRGIDRAIAAGEVPGPFDLHAPLLSLAHIFDTTLETIPQDIPYIRSDADLKTKWDAKMRSSSNQRVGLVWSGGPNPPDRSCKLSDFAPLAAAKNIQFFSLQLGDASRELSSPPAAMNIIDLAPQIRDFRDTAAILANLDLLISIDTAASHLAGAMGRPVWTLLKHAADYRWLIDREDSPWYPTMRLFRQPTRGDWTTPIARMASALATFAT